MYDPGLRKKIFTAAKKITAAKKKIEELLQDIQAKANEIGKTASDPEVIELMSEFYINTDIEPKWISKLFGLGNNVNRMKQLISKQTTKCITCGKDIKVLVSRTPREERQIECGKCQYEVQWAGYKKAEEQSKLVQTVADAAYLAKIAHLKQMPYDEYLKTTWWQILRADAMKRARGRCQTCNRNDIPLHVHHRTYEHRGEEPLSDLIVLCEDCHGKLHEVKK